MISVWVALWVMAWHWFGDFVMQTHEMATGKSKSNYWLTKHVYVYTAIMGLAAAPLVPTYWFVWLAFNGAAHWVTDYFTSRWSSKYFKVGDYHNGFVVVGIDQFVHLACLLLSTEYLLY